jgi:serine/threonine-protein kinase RsbT
MTIQVLSSDRMPIASEDDIVLVRRRARALVQQRGFDPFAVAVVTTAASELARNTWAHGKGGCATLEVLLDGTRAGLRMRFDDEGPGITDLDRALAGGTAPPTPSAWVFRAAAAWSMSSISSRCPGMAP